MQAPSTTFFLLMVTGPAVFGGISTASNRLCSDGWGEDDKFVHPPPAITVGTAALLKAFQPPPPGSAVIGGDAFLGGPRFFFSCNPDHSPKAGAQFLHHCHTHWSHRGHLSAPVATGPVLLPVPPPLLVSTCSPSDDPMCSSVEQRILS